MEKRICLAALMLAAVAGESMAASNAEDIARLGKDLTPWGAEKAGNADGSIPAYNGRLRPPASYDPAKPDIRPDPFVDEKPLYSVTAANLDEHAERVSEGFKAMLRKYPGFRMDVYPTHRTANYPDYVLDNTRKNAATCELTEDRLQLAGTCYGGVPFPIPQNGSEVMWNRTLKYDQFGYSSPRQVSTLVNANGGKVLTARWAVWQTFPHYDPARSEPIGKDEITEYLRIEYNAPARKAGEKLVIHDSVDMLDIGRRAWSYLPGQRRVKLSPDIAYDTPGPSNGGVGTVDDTQVFYGAHDRYDFKLLGKREMYIPYNTFKLNDPTLCSDDKLLTPNFLNPDCLRWELHRVWAVEATLKPGKRHVYPRRVFYFDEDLPAVGMGDNYDEAGKIYRVTAMHYQPFYESTGHNSHEFVIYDLASGAYVRQDYNEAGGPAMTVTPPEQAKASLFYQPASLSGSGVR